MTKREKNLCKEIAEFMYYPSAFEVGGVECKLRDVIRCITKNNPLIFFQVKHFCEEMIANGDYDAYAYGSSDEKEVLKMIESDYHSVFYKELSYDSRRCKKWTIGRTSR